MSDTYQREIAMSRAAIADTAIGQFGIRAADEGLHRHDPDDELWNESLFYDWYTEDGSLAGHCRIGLLPAQDRIWFWLYVYDGTSWIAVDEARLPLSGLETAEDHTWSYTQPGLEFSRTVGEGLRHNTLRVRTFGRVISGDGIGRVVPVEVDVRVVGMGPCHSVGDVGVDGHTSDTYSAARFEQPTCTFGHMTIDGEEHPLDARGERDHSWGPRMWNMDWRFLVLNRPGLRAQAARICFDAEDPAISRGDAGHGQDGDDEDDAMTVGYFSVGHDAADTKHVEQVRFALTFDDDMCNPWHGRAELDVEDGPTLAGSIECITAAEIDASHVFTPPQQSVYRRALVRFTPDDGSAPCLGWLEINRFPAGCTYPED